MAAVVAWALVAAVAAGIVVILAPRRPPPTTEVPWDLAQNATRMVSIAGGLAAFTITGVVLLLSFAREPATIGTPVATAVGMFLVAFMSLVASAMMFANLTRAGIVRAGVDVQTMQYAIATMTFFRCVFLGWLALRPLIEAYGFDDLAIQIGWLVLVVAVVAGWALSIALLHRLGLVRDAVVVVVPLLALAGCGLAALAFATGLRDRRADTSTLYLTYAMFGLTVASFLGYAAAPAVLEHARLGPILARRWGTIMAVNATLSGLVIGFIWLATAGAL